MPLYEYKCHRCGKNFEVRQKFSDEHLTAHEECGGEVERLISAPALQFKGTGWYVTDYGRGGKSPASNGSNGKNESKGESGSDSKTDTKSSTTTKSDSSSASKTETKSS